MGDSFTVGVQRLWQDDLPAGAMGLAWLGQAGFAARSKNHRWLIDPYLSDFLAEKYRGAEFPHLRMMQAPIEPSVLADLDWVFCTHRHSDHMDPGTLPHLAKSNPECRFIVPRAELAAAVKAGVPPERTAGVNAGETLELSPNLTVRVVAAAHETLKVNEQGDHHFLGYILETEGLSIYHSGDCVPYRGLTESLLQRAIDVALLPVNGRDAYRMGRGVPGNLTFSEARDLCIAAGIPIFIPHHFGMFEFNTPTGAEIDAESRQPFPGICSVPTLDSYFLLSDVPGQALSVR
jgi:L-ascorbate metabolism protein UlaG (beta-lactamase superfamily)